MNRTAGPVTILDMTTSTDTHTAAPFTVGQRVLATTFDFRPDTDNGQRPRVCTVEAIEPWDGHPGLFQVTLRKPDGHIKGETVGRRGGKLRPVADDFDAAEGEGRR